MNEEVTQQPQDTQSNKTGLIIGVVLVLGIIGFLIFNTTKSKTANTLPSNNPNSTQQTAADKSIALSEIETHKTKEDCWTAINGEVFDLTNFISKHKGGDKILAACGVDATDYFTGKHPTIGRVHSEMATKLLSSMKIGTLQK